MFQTVYSPVVLVNCNLASRSSAVGRAASLGGSSLGTGEVEGLGQDNDASRRVLEVGGKLGSSGRVDGGGAATASDALGKAFSGANDGVRGRGQGSKGSQCRGEDGCRSHGAKLSERTEVVGTKE